MNLFKISLFSLGFGALLFACDSTKSSEGEVAQQGAPGSGNIVTTPSATVGQADEGPFAAFEFEALSHDFGTINQGDKVTHTFTFTNTGEAPLVISRAKGSCGCTVPSYPEEPIPPGAQGEIVVEFDSTGKSGTQNKTVTLSANTPETQTILRISAQIAS